jgi:hypothetical protein
MYGVWSIFGAYGDIMRLEWKKTTTISNKVLVLAESITLSTLIMGITLW